MLVNAEADNTPALDQPARTLLFGLTDHVRAALVDSVWRRFNTTHTMTAAMCEDAVSSALTKAHIGNPCVRVLGDWLFVVACNELRSALRCYAVRNREYTMDPAEAYEISPLRVTHEARVPDALTALVAQESRDALRDALAQLKPKHRRVVWLLHYVGLTHNVIALRMRTNVGVTKMRALRGRRELQRLLLADARFDLSAILRN